MAPPLVPQQVAQASQASQQEIQAGQQLAAQGAGAATACVGCHGAQGEGNAQAGFPRLAGQGRFYLAHQLDSYANGSRKNQVMQPIAAALDDKQRTQVAAYYASLGNAPAQAATIASARDPVLAVRGDNQRRLQACANCHGPQGVGDAAADPYLAGQHATYLNTALAEWKSGDRNNDPSGQMPDIAKALTAEETKQLVTYYAGLTAPAARNAQGMPSPLPADRVAVQSGPVSGTPPLQGTGSEQGALTGGSQGQGAGGAATNPARTPGAPPSRPASR